jgi:hypothetical protein
MEVAGSLLLPRNFERRNRVVAPVRHPQIRQASAERPQTVRRASSGARLPNTKRPTRLGNGVHNLYGGGHMKFSLDFLVVYVDTPRGPHRSRRYRHG